MLRPFKVHREFSSQAWLETSAIRATFAQHSDRVLPFVAVLFYISIEVVKKSRSFPKESTRDKQWFESSP